MTDRIRTLTAEMMTANQEATKFGLAQNKLVEQQLASTFEAGRKSAELTGKLGETLGRAWLDAVAPAPVEA